MKIGVVDVDTSHPGNWVPIEKELGHEVIGVWDGGSVHPPQYVRQFAEQHGIPKVYDSLEAMAADVDCAIIHGCDWDTHVEKARPFVEAGKAVLIDKPIAGKLRDLNQLRAWAADGARITGGSSLRFCQETLDWLAQDVEKRGQPDTVVCGCAVDEFNYGIHAYAMLAGLMGPGAVRVRHLGKGLQRRVQIDWPDGRTGIVVIGQTDKWSPFYATVVTNTRPTQFTANAKDLYRSTLKIMLPYLAGDGEMPVTFDQIIEPELWALAALRSWSQGDRWVEIGELSEDDPGYDGATFAVGYRKAKYPDAS